MTKAIIFDMDGVLTDNSPVHAESFVLFCERHGVAMTIEDLMPYFGMGNEEIIPAVFKRDMDRAEIDALAEEKEVIYREIFEERIAPMEGLIPLLKGLKERGVKIALGSSGMKKNVDFVMQKCNIEGYFDAMAYGDLLTKAKPDPEVFLLAAKLINIDPSECLVFEDSFAGVKAARAAGMKVVVLATTYKKEQHEDYDLIIDDFREVNADQILAL